MLLRGQGCKPSTPRGCGGRASGPGKSAAVLRRRDAPAGASGRKEWPVDIAWLDRERWHSLRRQRGR